jgi:hypothetical protein
VNAPDLNPYQCAYLAGGPGRVVDTVLVALVRSGRVRVHSPGQLATVDLTRRDPVEAAALDAVGPSGHRSVDTIHWRLSEDVRLLEVGRQLQATGLIGRVGARKPWGRSHGSDFPLTRDGKQALARLRHEQADTDDVWRVALDGPAAMQDEELRASIFEPPRHDPEDRSRRSIRAARADADRAATTGFGDFSATRETSGGVG